MRNCNAQLKCANEIWNKSSARLKKYLVDDENLPDIIEYSAAKQYIEV